MDIFLYFLFHINLIYLFSFLFPLDIRSLHSSILLFALSVTFIRRQVWWCISLFDFKPIKPYLIIISPSACFKLSRSYPFDLLSLLIFITVFESLLFWPTAKTEKKNTSFVIVSTKIKQRIHKKSAFKFVFAFWIL